MFEVRRRLETPSGHGREGRWSGKEGQGGEPAGEAQDMGCQCQCGPERPAPRCSHGHRVGVKVRVTVPTVGLGVAWGKSPW